LDFKEAREISEEGNIVDFLAEKFKGKREIIVEVETPSSYKKDAPQRKVFKKYASKSPNRKFRTKKIK